MDNNKEPSDRAEGNEPDPDNMHDALLNIKRWVEAYPVTAFPPVDLEAARQKFGDDNLFSRLHAEWARHILSGITRYVEAGLAPRATAAHLDIFGPDENMVVSISLTPEQTEAIKAVLTAYDGTGEWPIEAFFGETRRSD